MGGRFTAAPRLFNKGGGDDRSWSRTIARAAERGRGAGADRLAAWFRRPQDQRPEILKGERTLGWRFAAPALIGLIVFLVVPIIFTVWMSFTNWNGLVSPLDAECVGLENYRETLFEEGIRRRTSPIAAKRPLLRARVVPIQTFVAFVLAVIVNQKFLKGRGFFRTSYYFPSITSSIAVSLIFIFLFQINGVVNASSPSRTSTGWKTPTAYSI